jgi:hypothetical protein
VTIYVAVVLVFAIDWLVGIEKVAVSPVAERRSRLSKGQL